MKISLSFSRQEVIGKFLLCRLSDSAGLGNGGEKEY